MSVMQAWNASIISENRHPEGRKYLYASELGASDIDTWLKMNGVAYSNLPDNRALRKFDAGNHHEGLVQNVMRRLGIVVDLSKEDKRVICQREGLLDVHGRVDIVLNGTTTKESVEKTVSDAHNELESMKYDDPFKESELKKTIKVGRWLIDNEVVLNFNNNICEVKSVSVYVFNNIEESREPIDRHFMQQQFYVSNTDSFNNQVGKLLYLSRDDLRLMEFDVDRGDQYLESVRRKSYFYKANERPELEPLIIEEKGKLKINFNVMYSNYLTLLYGFEHSESYRNTIGKSVSSCNRVIGRLVEGKSMTAKNEKILEDIKRFGFDVDKLVEARRHEMS